VAAAAAAQQTLHKVSALTAAEMAVETMALEAPEPPIRAVVAAEPDQTEPDGPEDQA
jgi:hypothetical protein